MPRIPNSIEDILKSPTARALPLRAEAPRPDIAAIIRGQDNFHRVFAIRSGDHVVMPTDPLVDPGVCARMAGT